MAELPSHLAVGRGAMPGPVAGGYLSFSFYLNDASAPGIGTPIRVGFVAPFDMRLERIDYRTRGASPGASDVDARAYKNTAAGGFSITGGTAFHASIDVDLAGVYSVSQNSGATAAFVSSAARNVLAGECVFVEYTYDGTGVLNDHTVVFTVFTQGHVNVLPTND